MGPLAHSRAGAAAALVLMALATGCPGKPSAADAGDARGSPGAATSTTRTGVPRPPGWNVWVAEDDSLQVGPAGRAVLRVDKRPGQGEDLPSAEALARQALQALEGLGARVERTESPQDMALVLVRLAPGRGDGGPTEPALVFFGARRMGDDLFLCSSTPGSSEEEVRAALETCRSIQVQKPGR